MVNPSVVAACLNPASSAAPPATPRHPRRARHPLAPASAHSPTEYGWEHELVSELKLTSDLRRGYLACGGGGSRDGGGGGGGNDAREGVVAAAAQGMVAAVEQGMVAAAEALSALFALGGAQGLIGWWMVKSGLEEPTSEYVQPRVSPYRLATHLTSAFVIYCGILWTALSVAMPDPPTGSMSWVNGAAKIRKLAIPVSAIVGITAISGAFVAGNDAGHAYNSFPKMGDTWIPEDVFSMEPFIRNFFENTSMVQLTHRILATTTLLSVGGLWLAARRIDMHPAVKSLIGSTLGMAALQVTLGISTLLMYVPTSLGSAHQAGALSLLSLMILLTHTLRRPSPALLKSLATAVKAT
nr:unnamed protein product [Digitaria exilis]